MPDDAINKSINQLSKLVEQAQSNLDRIKNLLEKINEETSKPKYEDMPGVDGVFDGQFLVGEDGNRYEVPTNYAAKSRLVYGDKLKIVDVDGKQLFKQVEKVNRRRSSGILTKKEGLWFVLTDTGSYKISDTAAEFNSAKLNDEAIVIVPADNLDAPFAALDKILNKNDQSGGQDKQEKPKSDAKRQEVKKTEKKITKKKPVKKSKIAKTSSSVKKTSTKSTPKSSDKEDTPKATTKSILEEDDLV